VEGAEEAGVARRCRRRRSAGDGHWVGNGRPGGGAKRTTEKCAWPVLQWPPMWAVQFKMRRAVMNFR
jgi:hypothetical protein